ncbi:MAG TPA: amidase [Bacillales bacterium]|nr:amidase [Bacillales bacterium]
MKLLDMDATEVAVLIKTGEISSSEATQKYIGHLRHVNPALNCLVEDRFEKTSLEARDVDREIKEGKANGKLSGVPISMKEAYHVADMKTTGGLMHRKDKVIYLDAAVVSKLKAEGAIILGKSNTPTLCFCQESENKLYGRTNNPWDRGRTAGGSSGGEGALIAAGGAAAGVGSDIGGSIRFPAHFNGVIGFKSGDRQVPQQGNFPYIEHPFQERMLGMGPMVKSIRDAKLIYNIIAKTPAPEKDMSDFTMTILPRILGFPLSDVTEALLLQIKETLGDEFRTQGAVPPFFNDVSLLWQEIMSIDGGAGVAKIAFGDRSASIFAEYSKEVITGKAELHRYLTWALIGAKLFRPSKKRVTQIGETLAYGDELLDKYLEKRILIFPVYHQAAPRHGKLYNEIFSVRKTFLRYMPYIAYANVWGLPALTVPVGIDEHGMPISVQLMSKNGNEDALFQLGSILEKQFRGYVRCKQYDAK